MPYKRPSQKSLDNLKKGKPFKKGQSGNPKGRPRELPELKEVMVNVLSEEKSGITAAEAIIRALFNKAIKGDVRAAEALLNRGYGMPRQVIDQNTTHELKDFNWEEFYKKKE